MEHPTSFSHLDDFGFSTDPHRVSNITEQIVNSPISLLTTNHNNNDDEPPNLVCHLQQDDDLDNDSDNDSDCEEEMVEVTRPNLERQNLNKNPFFRRPDGGYTFSIKILFWVSSYSIPSRPFGEFCIAILPFARR